MTSATQNLDQSSPIPDGVIRRSELITAGVSNYTLATRCRPGGPWQILLPGVLLLAKSPPTRWQLLRAAVLYAGEGAIITGTEALHEYGLSPGDASEVHVLVGASRRVSSRDYVRVERTKRPPSPMLSHGLQFAPPGRAAADAARHSRDPTHQRELLFAPIHAGLCTLEQIRTELDAGAQRGTAALRALLGAQTSAPITTTVHHGWAKRVVKQAPLPAPTWDVPIYHGRELIGVADAWWDEVGLAWDFDNQRDNLGHSRRDAFRHAGLITVQTSVAELRGNPEAVATELTSAFARAARRPRPPVGAGP